MITAWKVADILLYLIFLGESLYLLYFTIMAHYPRARPSGEFAPARRFAILIPAYREDNVIAECVRSCLSQKYPPELYETVVISDRMSPETDEALRSMGATVVNVYFENSTKSKALNHAMEQLGDGYDLALVLDADNTIGPEFLSELNAAFCADSSLRIVQAHRCAKNINTDLALLDAVSEEINNCVFRQGHSNSGLSAALIGSGMCFDYALFKRTMAGIDAVGGFDRALELTLLKKGYRIGYLPDSAVLDEKIQRHSDFTRQRRRWMSAQFHYMRRFAPDLPHALRTGNIDFCDKWFQQMSLPKLLLMGITFIAAVATTFIPFIDAWKWWALLAVLVGTAIAAIPRHLMGKRLLKAVVQLPYTFILMMWGLLRVRGANKKFIHTSHGIDSRGEKKQ